MQAKHMTLSTLESFTRAPDPEAPLRSWCSFKVAFSATDSLAIGRYDVLVLKKDLRKTEISFSNSQEDGNGQTTQVAFYVLFPTW